MLGHSTVEAQLVTGFTLLIESGQETHSHFILNFRGVDALPLGQ